MTIIQSYKKMSDNHTNNFINSVCYTLSYIYARKAGIGIRLHTDSFGKNLLDHIPYEEVVVDLDDVSGYDCNLYAYPKIYALKNEPIGTIHTDGDVFLKKESIKSLLVFGDADVIVQSLEDRTRFGVGYTESMQDCGALSFENYVTKGCNRMYNCGILGFNNEELKDRFIGEYERLADEYKSKKLGVKGSVPDLIIEQKLLHDMANGLGYEVKTLLDYENLNTHAKEIGYCHVVGIAKTHKLKEMLRKVYELDIEIYNKLKSKWVGTFNCFWV